MTFDPTASASLRLRLALDVGPNKILGHWQLDQRSRDMMSSYLKISIPPF